MFACNTFTWTFQNKTKKEVVFSFFSDITFIHEGNKTFHDNLVNFEKLVSEKNKQQQQQLSTFTATLKLFSCFSHKVQAFNKAVKRRLYFYSGVNVSGLYNIGVPVILLFLLLFLWFEVKAFVQTWVELHVRGCDI